jgi:hypothetical protein
MAELTISRQSPKQQPQMPEVQGAAKGDRKHDAEEGADASGNYLRQDQQHAAYQGPTIDVGRQSSSQFAVMTKGGGALKQVAAIDIAILAQRPKMRSPSIYGGTTSHASKVSAQILLAPVTRVRLLNATPNRTGLAPLTQAWSLFS